MNELSGLTVLFIAGFGPIVRDEPASRRLYAEHLGVGFKEELGGYLHTERLEGAKAFALWPLSLAAEACFGAETWPDGITVPQAWLEFEVDRLEPATDELERRGYRMLVRNRTEPWGQTVSRFLSPEGLLLAVTFTPWMRPEI